MTKYKCGHKTDGIIILDSNVLSINHYLEWSESVGVFGIKEQCWECWNKKLDENIKSLRKGSYKTHYGKQK